MKKTDKSEIPVPNFAWYQKQSKEMKSSPRCPFASANQCPRYFRTLWLFGKSAQVEPMPSIEIEKLEEHFCKSPLFSLESQTGPEVKGGQHTLTVQSWWHCCPEVVFDAYGVFATSGSHLGDKDDTRLWEKDLQNKNVHPDDWRWKYTHLEPAHFSACREYSILVHAYAGSVVSKQRGARPEARNISQKQRWEIFVRDNFTCKYCGRKPPEVALAVDHFISVDADGTKEPDNLVTSCQDCNSGKSNRPPPKL